MRLRSYCQQVAREKKAAHRDEEYWGKPVPGFGDPHARVLILGLAPAAHGANRTGRVFTGDGVGGSGDFLMAALHRAGFANIDTSRHPADGLRLRDAYIAATVRCAPPDNKPLPAEIAACASHLDAEVIALRRLEIVVALGKIAWDAWFQLLARQRILVRPRPSFGHGRVFPGKTGAADAAGAASAAGARVPRVPTVVASGVLKAPVALVAPGTGGTCSTRGTCGTCLIGCFHPSRQNTNTGKVTAAMYDDVFRIVVERLREPI